MGNSPSTTDKQDLLAVINMGNIGNPEPIFSKIKVWRNVWKIGINGSKASIQAFINRNRPISPFDPEPELERAIAYTRSAMTFAFETPTQRGFESSFVAEENSFFPSEHDLRTHAYKNSSEALEIGKQVLDDIGKRYNRQLHKFIEYWRRGFELQEMNYIVEAYLNYYKVLEAMSRRGARRQTSPLRAQLISRHNTKKFRHQYRLTKEDIKTAAGVFGYVKYNDVPEDMFRAVCNFAHIRNHFEIGHSRDYLTTGYWASGQYSEDFDLTATDVEKLREIAKIMILHSIGLNKYWLDGSAGVYILRHPLMMEDQ